MKKLVKLEDFKQSNGKVVMSGNHMHKIVGGEEQTRDICSTLNETCNNNCSDIYQVTTRDGVVVKKVETTTNNDCSLT